MIYFSKGGIMKKQIIVGFIALILLCACSCSIVESKVELSQSAENVQSIQVFYSERVYDVGNIADFLEENEPFAIFESEKYNDLLNELRELEYQKWVLHLLVPQDGGYDYGGYIIAVLYSDGGYDIIAEEGLFSYYLNKKGEGRCRYDYSDYCGELPWNDFIKKYI